MKTYRISEEEKMKLESANQVTEEKKDAKGGKNAPPVEEAEPEPPMPDTQQSEILVHKRYSDDRDKTKSLHTIVQEIPDANFYI